MFKGRSCSGRAEKGFSLSNDSREKIQTPQARGVPADTALPAHEGPYWPEKRLKTARSSLAPPMETCPQHQPHGGLKLGISTRP